MLTSKTGHYTTTEKEFKTFVEFLNAAKAIGDKTLCVPDTSGQTNGTWKTYLAKDSLVGRLNVAPKTELESYGTPLNKDNWNCRNFWLRLA